MKTRLWGALAGIVVLGLLAATLTACGGSKKTTASTAMVTKATASTAVVTTLAGKAGPWGSADGSGAAARFDIPVGIACDAAGNLYVADTYNCTIRKITPAGDVTTLAGKARFSGSADGRGGAARFWRPYSIACGAAGNLYVADTNNGTIRKITLSH
jgi:sugar lactone lactonase YvrE